MRAVCTRGRLEGDENGHGCMRTHEGRVEGRSSLFLHATAERIHPRAKKLYYFGGKILFRPSANPSFVSPPFFPFSFFSNRPPSFPDRASPPERGGNRGGERGETAAPLHTRDSQPDSLLFLVIILRAFCSFVVAVVQLRSL